MPLFVDEVKSKQHGTVVQRRLMSNTSLEELNAAATALGLAVKTFKKKWLPHYQLTEAQAKKAVEDGASFVEFASEEWYAFWKDAKILVVKK